MSDSNKRNKQVNQEPAPVSGDGNQTRSSVPEDLTPIPTGNICPDTTADFNLYIKNKAGKHLLYRGANTTMTEEHKATLEENGVQELFIAANDRKKYLRYVESNLNSIMTGPAPEAEKASIMYQSTHQLVKDVMDKPELGENIERVEALVDTTINQFMNEEHNLTNMLDVMAFDYTLYTHSINVCIFGLALGRNLGLPVDELQTLGAGLMLHDVGKTQIPGEILFKEGPLNDDEWQMMRKHPAYGKMILAPSGKVSDHSMRIVFEHHEKCAGSGYPQGLECPDIDPLAKIASIADVFDALTTKRVYKDEIMTFPALKIMLEKMSGSFEPDYLQAFIQLLSLAGDRSNLAA